MLKGPPLTQFAKGSFRDPHQAIRRGCGDLALLDLQDLRHVLHRPAVGLAGGQEGQGQGCEEAAIYDGIFTVGVCSFAECKGDGDENRQQTWKDLGFREDGT